MGQEGRRDEAQWKGEEQQSQPRAMLECHEAEEI
jgi:hypothetical protein